MTNLQATPPGITREVRVELALSALMLFCQLLIKGGQLNQNEERDLNTLLRSIEQVLGEKT